MRRHIADYYGMISHLDAQIGRLLDELEVTGHANDTIVIYTADHGLALGQHGLLGKQNVYDHSLRVPLIIRGPDVPPGERRDGLCYLMDVCPTILDLAGLDPPTECEGLSLVPMIQGAELDVRESIFSAFQRDQEVGVDDPWQRSVRWGDWKLIETGAMGERHTQLFNLVSDPWEMRNLATQAAHAERLDAMRSRLMHERTVGGDTYVTGG